MTDELFAALGSAIQREKDRRKMAGQHTTDDQATCPCPSCRHYQSINDGTHDPFTCPWTEAHEGPTGTDRVELTEDEFDSTTGHHFDCWVNEGLGTCDKDCTRLLHARCAELENRLYDARRQRDDLSLSRLNVLRQAEEAWAERDALQATLDRVTALADEWGKNGINCECGHSIGGEHNGIGCYARLSYEPLVTCGCKLTDDRFEGEVAVRSLRAALTPEGSTVNTADDTCTCGHTTSMHLPDGGRCAPDGGCTCPAFRAPAERDGVLTDGTREPYERGYADGRRAGYRRALEDAADELPFDEADWWYQDWLRDRAAGVGTKDGDDDE